LTQLFLKARACVRSLTLALALPLAIVSSTGCGAGDADPFELDPGTPVVIIVIDTLRADHLSCYGYDLPTSPVIDAFAASATFFESNSTQFNSTFPSLTSIFTGLYPKTHGNYLAVPIPGTTSRSEGTKSLAERFGEAGYQTLAVLSHPSWASVDRDIALMRGWDEFSNIDDPISIEERPLYAHAEYTHERLFPMLDDRRSSAEQRPLFLWVHYFDPHTDLPPTVYNAPEPYRNIYLQHHLDLVGLPEYYDDLAPLEPFDRTAWIRDNTEGEVRANVDLANGRALYDAEITSCDAGIGRLFDRLRADGLFDEAVIVLMADHGENMEPASHGHGPINFTHNRLFESVAHTPLMIRMPGQTEGTRVSAITQNIDLAPTLLELLDLPTRPAVEGQSLVPLLRDPSASLHERIFIESSKGGEKVVRTETLKLMDLGEDQDPQLFAWRDDPEELRDLAGSSSPETVADLRQQVAGFRPVHTLRVRFIPAAEPFDVTFEVSSPRDRFDEVVGGPLDGLSEDAHTYRATVHVTDEPIDWILFPKGRHAEKRFRITHSSLAPADAVWIGQTQIQRSSAVPLWNLSPGAELAPPPADPLVTLDRRADGRDLSINTAPAARVEVDLRYLIPTYRTDFTVLERQGFDEPVEGRARTMLLSATGSASVKVSFGEAGAGLDVTSLIRIDGAWPDLDHVRVDGHGVDQSELAFLIPHPPDGRITQALQAGVAASPPPGSVVIWMESLSGDGEIDPSNMAPELVEQLRTLGYFEGK
jgi:arylsulfatase